uniref:Uncharacterized protein n=1 Tax=Anguilla anguilla TaxID=7936 RepID=A0A0E9R900_ANGAN
MKWIKGTSKIFFGEFCQLKKGHSSSLIYLVRCACVILRLRFWQQWTESGLVTQCLRPHDSQC